MYRNLKNIYRWVSLLHCAHDFRLCKKLGLRAIFRTQAESVNLTTKFKDQNLLCVKASQFELDYIRLNSLKLVELQKMIKNTHESKEWLFQEKMCLNDVSRQAWNKITFLKSRSGKPKLALNSHNCRSTTTFLRLFNWKK